MPSLVEKLVKSGRAVFTTNTWGSIEYEGDVADLVRKIEDACASAQFQLVRYVDGPVIRWAVIPAAMERPESLCIGTSAFMRIVEFHGIEGKTKRCRAYHALSALWDETSKMIRSINLTYT